jgi:hypothetical protein
VSTYSFVAPQLKELYGEHFMARNMADGSSVTFTIGDKTGARARSGLEAFGILVDCKHPRHGVMPSFLKIFRTDVPERRPRTEFLIRQALARKHAWLFHGVPYAWIPDRQIKNVAIIGHVALQIGAKFGGGAEDFSRLKAQGAWPAALDLETRRKLAAELCVAVASLEMQQIVHGDISSGNIMVGFGPNSGEKTCTLCDFDGFFHPAVESLPRWFDGQPCRPIGSAGYQYPELMARLAADSKSTDQGIMVETDRFALATIICELMTWSPALETSLNRSELLSEDVILSRSLTALPGTLTRRWPEGFGLLERALQANSTGAMPSPEDWLAALGFQVSSQASFVQRPHFRIYKRLGNVRTSAGSVLLANRNSGDFQPVDVSLADIGFSFSDQRLIFDVKWPHPIFVTRNGQQRHLGNGPQSITLGPNDTFSSNFWEIEIRDGARLV